MPLDLDILNPCDRCMRKGDTCVHDELVNNVALLIAAVHFYFLSWFFNWKLGVLVFFAMMYFFVWQIFLNIRSLHEQFNEQAVEADSAEEDEDDGESTSGSEVEEGEITENGRAQVIHAALEPSDSDSDELPELIPTSEAWPRRRNPNYLEEVD